MTSNHAIVTALVVLALAGPSAGWESGPEWEEPFEDDAGALPRDAAPVIGPEDTLVLKIRGILDGLSPGAGDFQDMFLINIVTPSAFSAIVDPAETPFDTQLWLFEFSELGLLGNDDNPAAGATSYLLGSSDDGSGAAVTTAGRYYLAISGSISVPESAGGRIFDQATTTEISGPDGPGGTLAITEWSRPGADGRYVIDLAGVEFIPCPGDVDGDGEVGFSDLLDVLSLWGPCAGCPEDVDGDGMVGFSDVLAVLSNWGPCV